MSRSDTTAQLDSRNTGQTPGLLVGRLTMLSDHLSRFVPNADATGIAAVALGGAESLVDIVTDSGLRVRSGARVTARDIDMTAKINEVTQVFYGIDMAEQINAYPNSFGGYQKIDTATFFG